MFSFRRVAQQSAAVFRGVSAAQWPGAVVQPAALKTCTPACAREYSDFGDGAGGSGGDQGLDRPWMKTSRNDNNETQSSFSSESPPSWYKKDSNDGGGGEYIVFASKSECNRCGTAKPEGLDPTAVPTLRSSSNSNARYSEGDWLCPTPGCGNVCFGRKNTCNLCGSMKPQNATLVTETEAPKKREAREGDWSCVCGIGASGSISVEASHFNAIVERVDALEAAVKALEDANAGITPGAGDGEGDGEGESEEELDAAAIVGDDTTADEESAPEEGGAGSGEVDANADTDAEIAETVEEDAADPNAAPN
eukprot:gene337-30613_t